MKARLAFLESRRTRDIRSHDDADLYDLYKCIYPKIRSAINMGYFQTSMTGGLMSKEQKAILVRNGFAVTESGLNGNYVKIDWSFDEKGHKA